MNQAKYWTPIIEKFQSKLSGWKSRTLSFGGRLTLVKAVLGNLPTAPKRVVESLEKIRRRFLWGGSEGNRKINWVSWEKVTSPKEHGGLGIGSIRSLNIALLIKNKPMAYLHKKKIAGVWGNIANIKNDIEELGIGYNNILKKFVKSGTETQFWRDYWVGNTTLKEKYPGLYELERKKSCSVAERIRENGFTGRWYVCPSSAGLLVQYNLLLRDIANTTPSNGEDQFRCTLAPDGDYCVGLMRSRIENKSITNAGELRISWGKTVPIKVSAFVWRANMGRIPSAIELNRRGLKLGSTYCSSCISGDECCDHLLVKCPYATMVRNMIFQWCNIIRPQTGPVQTVGNPGDCPGPTNPRGPNFLSYRGNGKSKVRLTAICYCLIWCLWRARNERIFKGMFIAPNRVVENIKSLVFLWVKCRGSGNCERWEDWDISPSL
uniref:Reverse transcriptase zinc-binding domain-containing protein n=1 Tax=Lactuca sativa TaxID=4236 RepID=A0A9R1UWR0_LACSA|nr:hypothetical protein LSAT_V11C800435930 [Lactuca sativa]